MFHLFFYVDPTGTSEEELQAAAYEEALDDPEAQELPAPEPPRIIEDDGRIIGLTIHRTDKLKTDFFIAHPMVRVHVVDMNTGNYLKKQDRSEQIHSCTYIFVTRVLKIIFKISIFLTSYRY